MTHITIPSNSYALYDYILPLIINIDTLASDSKELYDKVKVFINGAWVGITNEPLELYNNLKQKK